VIKLMGYLGMDVQVMTRDDWLGVFFAVFVFTAMVYVYFMVFRPANKDKFESQRAMALDDDEHFQVGEK
jgi:cbb3-type cytochrome oxidase subunit 3